MKGNGGIVTFALLAMGNFLVAAGCSSVPKSDGNFPPTGAEHAGAAAAAPQFIAVEFREKGKKPDLMRLPMHGPLYVQDAIEQTEATKRFRRLEIELFRAAAGQAHKMEVEYDRASKRVNPLFDYALHPGDRLVIIEDTRTTLDDIFDSIAGPMGMSSKK